MPVHVQDDMSATNHQLNLLLGIIRALDACRRHIPLSHVEYIPMIRAHIDRTEMPPPPTSFSGETTSRFITHYRSEMHKARAMIRLLASGLLQEEPDLNLTLLEVATLLEEITDLISFIFSMERYADVYINPRLIEYCEIAYENYYAFCTSAGIAVDEYVDAVQATVDM